MLKRIMPPEIVAPLNKVEVADYINQTDFNNNRCRKPISEAKSGISAS